LQVTVVNDGGCHLPEDELRQLLTDVQFQVISLEQNQGRARAGNVGIEAAQGRYVGFLDDDDQLFPNHVALLMACLEGGEYRVCYSDAEICRRRFNAQTACFEIIDCHLFASRDFVLSDLLIGNYIPLICLLFDREVLVASGGFDPVFDLYEDWDLLLRVGAKHPFYHIPQITAQYIQWSAELQVSQTELTRGFQAESHDKIIEKHRDRFTPEVTRHWLRIFKELEQARAQLIDKEAELAQTRVRLAGAEEQIKGAQSSLAATLSSLEHECKLSQRWTATASTLQEQISALEGQCQMLERELSLIRASRAWRLVQAYGRWRNTLLPRNSPARAIARKLRSGMQVLKRLV
jgi:hypothetical protein